MQQGEQLRALAGLKSRADASFLDHCFGLSLGQQRFAPLGEMQYPSSSIRKVRSSYEKSLTFEVVNDRNHRARGNRQEVADRLLCLTQVTVDGVQYGEMAWFETQFADYLTELARGLETNLGQGESHGVPRHRHAGVVRCGLFVGGNLVHKLLYTENDSC